MSFDEIVMLARALEQAALDQIRQGVAEGVYQVLVRAKLEKAGWDSLSLIDHAAGC